MPLIMTPDQLVKALEALRDKSTKSVPELSSHAGDLAQLLKNGQETKNNTKGIQQFQKVLKQITVWVDRVNMEETIQSAIVGKLEESLYSLHRDLQFDSEGSGTVPLDFFATIKLEGSNRKVESPFEMFIKELSVEVRKLEDIVCPELKPKGMMVFDFAGCKIDSTTNNGSGDVGSFNYGEQVHHYALASVNKDGHVASGNVNDPLGKLGFQAVLAKMSMSQ